MATGGARDEEMVRSAQLQPVVVSRLPFHGIGQRETPASRFQASKSVAGFVGGGAETRERIGIGFEVARL